MIIVLTILLMLVLIRHHLFKKVDIRPAEMDLAFYAQGTIPSIEIRTTDVNRSLIKWGIYAQVDGELMKIDEHLFIDFSIIGFDNSDNLRDKVLAARQKAMLEYSAEEKANAI